MGHVKLILVSARYALHVRLCCLAGIISKLHIILVKTHLIPGGVGRLPYYLIYSQSIAHLLKYRKSSAFFKTQSSGSPPTAPYDTWHFASYTHLHCKNRRVVLTQLVYHSCILKIKNNPHVFACTQFKFQKQPSCFCMHTI